jgi:hypothetical protein
MDEHVLAAAIPSSAGGLEVTRALLGRGDMVVQGRLLMTMIEPAAERKRGACRPRESRPQRDTRRGTAPVCDAPAFRGACRLSRAVSATSACRRGNSPRPAWRRRR